MTLVKLKSNFLIIALGFVLFLLTACGNESICDGINCGNGVAVETESECICDCSGTFYIGNNCETLDPTQLQALLNEGKTPLELLENGIPIDSFYGKEFKAGLIFYLTMNGEGMVAAPNDQDLGNLAVWGCFPTDIEGLNNVSTELPNSGNETLNGARIGDGFDNTNAILAGCSDIGIAAQLCRDLGPDWFLPSRGEFELMNQNLHAKGLGDFSNDVYWQSTEYDGNNAWFNSPGSTSGFYWDKESLKRVRAACAF